MLESTICSSSKVLERRSTDSPPAAAFVFRRFITGFITEDGASDADTVLDSSVRFRPPPYTGTRGVELFLV